MFVVWPETRFLGYIRSTLEVHFFDFILGVIKGKKLFFIGDFFWGVRGGRKFFLPIFAHKKSKGKNFFPDSPESVRIVMGSLCAEK